MAPTASLTLTAFVVVVVGLLFVQHSHSQTEGDTGYDDTYYGEYDMISVIDKDPVFDTPLANVTVKIGETALMPCSIDFLGKYKVAWLEQTSIPLTYEDRRVIDDSRFSIVRPTVKDWNLQLQDVRLEDGGPYRCTVNTKPVMTKIVSLLVTVPATIIDQRSSGDVTVREGHDVTIQCIVFGIPTPEVTWFRRTWPGKAPDENGDLCEIYVGPSATGWSPAVSLTKVTSSMLRHDVPFATGPSLTFINASRHCSDIYECIAENGVKPKPPGRQIRLRVAFVPQITLLNRRIGQSLGRQTILECTITAFPHAMNFWEKDGKRLYSINKYKIDAYEDSEHELILSLRIIDLEPSDYGMYKCVAKNELGQDEQTMELIAYPEHGSMSAGSAVGSRSLVNQYRELTSQQAVLIAPTGDQLQHHSERLNASISFISQQRSNKDPIIMHPKASQVLRHNDAAFTVFAANRQLLRWSAAVAYIATTTFYL